MDLLSKRYASPFFVLDDMIRLGQLHDFLTELFKEINEEEIERYRWEFYLHKVFDKTYEEYLNIVNDSNKGRNEPSMSKAEIMDVCAYSQNILEGFTY